ncbi:MAG: carboxypeptidase-like regulatory domain-containing protein [Chloroflexi bacterium]|nr:carboxypeptidase-like regulatory domain-containing protein [Chloroflexota bacterium]
MKIKIGIVMLAIAGLMMLSVGLISAQVAVAGDTVTGTVFDATTGALIEGATVAVDDSDPILSGTTDVNGDYVISSVVAGEPIVTASAPGYESESVGTTVTSSVGARVDFTLEPVDDDEEEAQGLELEEDYRDGEGKLARTRRGYVGIYNGSGTASATGSATSTATFTVTESGVVTGIGDFTVTTKHGERVGIQFPGVGAESATSGFETIIKTPGRPGRALADGDRVVVLVEFVDIGDGELAKVAIKVIVKPTTPNLHGIGAVVSVATDAKGVTTVGIMQRNGKIKKMKLGPDAEIPEIGDLITAFLSHDDGDHDDGDEDDEDGNKGLGHQYAKGIVKAENVQRRLENFLKDLKDEDDDSDEHADRVVDIAALLEQHAGIHLAILERLNEHKDLPSQANEGMRRGWEKARIGFANAKTKHREANLRSGRSNSERDDDDEEDEEDEDDDRQNRGRGRGN